MRKKLLKRAGWIIGAVGLVFVGLIVYIRIVSRMNPPSPASLAILDVPVTQPDDGLFRMNNNWFRQSESGLYELYVEGNAFELGVANGKLTKKLVRHQEEVFTEQIKTLVPSMIYRGALKYFVGWFNRDLDENISEAYKLEIYGVSLAASHDFNKIATPYQRILNYHAAHDIGHALQNMSLVGCTSFATWGSRSEEGSLIVGRNFDFYVGDDFARDKIVAFYKPDDGYRFMMITFGGMTGVLSGMNEKGLTVTINAAKSEVPSAAATPVSLVARDILQHAATIAEARSIAEKEKMFVSESFLIGSAIDGKAALIEKTPSETAYYESPNDYIISTNHFQSEQLGNTELNREHMRTSASPYRYARVKELLNQVPINSVQQTAKILRDRKGLHGANIGMGNEKTINQLVAHHAVIFEPEKRRVWISTAPWQLGKFVCYDLNTIFSMPSPTVNHEMYVQGMTVPVDSFLLTKDYREYVKFARYRFPFAPHDDIPADSLVKWNPDSYHAYMLAGDHYMEIEDYKAAVAAYNEGLTKEVATVQEFDHMVRNRDEANEHLK